MNAEQRFAVKNIRTQRIYRAFTFKTWDEAVAYGRRMESLGLIQNEDWIVVPV